MALSRCGFILALGVSSAAALSEAASLKLEKKMFHCSVCKHSVAYLFEQENKDVDSLLLLTDTMCDPDSKLGTDLWSGFDFDFATDGSFHHTLVDKRPELQFCHLDSECRRAGKICLNMVPDLADDLANSIAVNSDELDVVVDKMCNQWTKSCTEQTVPEGFVHQIVDEPFRALTEAGFKKLKQWKDYKKKQELTRMGLQPAIARLEKELVEDPGMNKGDTRPVPVDEAAEKEKREKEEKEAAAAAKEARRIKRRKKKKKKKKKKKASEAESKKEL